MAHRARGGRHGPWPRRAANRAHRLQQLLPVQPTLPALTTSARSVERALCGVLGVPPVAQGPEHVRTRKPGNRVSRPGLGPENPHVPATHRGMTEGSVFC
jgi:hypothetical protein